MERYSQFRDKGTGIAPFLPVATSPSGLYLPLHIFLFVIRVPLLLFLLVSYFLVLVWLPIGTLGRKALLSWSLSVPLVLWRDLRIDGVRRGSIGKKVITTRLPTASSVIVSSSTSPIDAIWLAAVFDPIFTRSYPGRRLVQRTSLLSCLLQAVSVPQLQPSASTSESEFTSISALLAKHPDRTIVVFPECTTTNGRAILPLSPSLLSAPPGTKIFPVSLHYTPPDVTTPVPGWSETLRFLWNLCSRPTHSIRVRIAEAVTLGESENEENAAGLTHRKVAGAHLNGRNGTVATSDEDGEGSEDDDDEIDDDDDEAESSGVEGEASAELSLHERKIVDGVGEALARLGRVKRVAIGVKEKINFVDVWGQRRRY